MIKQIRTGFCDVLILWTMSCAHVSFAHAIFENLCGNVVFYTFTEIKISRAVFGKSKDATFIQKCSFRFFAYFNEKIKKQIAVFEGVQKRELLDGQFYFRQT